MRMTQFTRALGILLVLTTFAAAIALLPPPGICRREICQASGCLAGTHCHDYDPGPATDCACKEDTLP